MADKTIGDLTEALQINDNDLFVLEQGDTAKKLTGQRLTLYIDRHVVSVTVTQLPEGSEPTAQYNTQMGVIALGIPKGDTGDTGNGIANVTLNPDYTLTINFTDGTSYTTTSIRGAQGEQGIQGIQGVPGADGADGIDGTDGKSAYQSARDGGYTGTEAQFNSDLAGIGGKYVKPASGIPKSDLASSVQTSLDKADSAIPNSEKGAANGVATLGADGKIPTSQLSIYLQETEPTGATNGSFWAWTPPYVVTTVRPSGTEISAGISTLSAAKIKELADAIATEATVDNNVETVYVWSNAENGYYTISIGDQISWTMNGTSYPYRIMGFNHYDKSDGSGKAGILFQMVDCFNTKYPMKSSTSSADGWDDSDLRTTLNSTLYGYLPSDVQSAISQVTINTAQDVSTSTIITTNDKLFVPAEVEVFGSTSYAKGGTNEGVWYPWYKANNNTSSRIKKVNGSSTYWFERSPRAWYSYASRSAFCFVTSSGATNYDYADYSRGVAPCFCF